TGREYGGWTRSRPTPECSRHKGSGRRRSSTGASGYGSLWPSWRPGGAPTERTSSEVPSNRVPHSRVKQLSPHTAGNMTDSLTRTPDGSERATRVLDIPQRGVGLHEACWNHPRHADR